MSSCEAGAQRINTGSNPAGPMTRPISIIVHGGAGKIPDEAVEGYRRGTEIAAQRGFEVLERGGTAEEAVETAVRAMEENPVFNCGIGASLNMEKHVEMDAFFMRGKDLNAGAVAGVSHILYPVSLARKVMEDTPHVMLAGEGAEAFAVQEGMELVDEDLLITEGALKRWEKVKKRRERQAQVSDTVGAVALDTYGNCASALSTGGTSCKLPGRIGDTPVIGSGGYADNRVGAAAATGIGEDLMKVVISKTALDFLSRQNRITPVRAAEMAMDYLRERVGGNEGGIIIVDMKGRVGRAFSAPRMGYAYIRKTEKRLFRGGGI